MKLDSIHAKILAELQSNARISNTQIAAAVGISSPAVAERIKKNGRFGRYSRLSCQAKPKEIGPRHEGFNYHSCFYGTVVTFFTQNKYLQRSC